MVPLVGRWTFLQRMFWSLLQKVCWKAIHFRKLKEGLVQIPQTIATCTEKNGRHSPTVKTFRIAFAAISTFGGPWCCHLRHEIQVTIFSPLFFNSHKDGFQAYEQWKKDWNSNSQNEGNLKMFMAERILPYWVNCCDCGKWRQYPLTEGDLTTDVVESWTCRSYRKLKKVRERISGCRWGHAILDARQPLAQTPSWNGGFLWCNALTFAALYLIEKPKWQAGGQSLQERGRRGKVRINNLKLIN